MNASDPYRPVRTFRAFEQVSARIRELLSSKDLKPGDRLPPERVLAARLGVSRNVLREGLRSLEIAGLVIQKRGGSGGTFIAAHSLSSVTQVFRDMMSLGAVSLSEANEARALILTDAIELACERASEEDFEAINENINETAVRLRQNDLESQIKAVTRFYELIAVAAKNKVLVATIVALTRTLSQFYEDSTPRRQLSADSPQRSQLFLVESRRKILKYLRERNPKKASQEMVLHLTGLHQYLLVNSKAAVPVRAASAQEQSTPNSIERATKSLPKTFSAAKRRAVRGSVPKRASRLT